MEFIGLFIAAGLGLWAWSDAKNLERRSIRVGSFSPVAWGWLVALLAIVFGIMYLVQRPKAIADSDAARLQAWQNAPRDIVDLVDHALDAVRRRGDAASSPAVRAVTRDGSRAGSAECRRAVLHGVRHEDARGRELLPRLRSRRRGGRPDVK